MSLIKRVAAGRRGIGTGIMVALLTALMGNPASAATVREISFTGADGLRLAGTLELPDGGGAAPALLLLPGSGATDRDGNQVNHVTDLLKQIADALAAQGIASLRYDKRGVGATASTIPTNPDASRDFVRWTHFVDDAAAAYRQLTETPGIDPNRVGIFGHSEGGLLAIEVATDAHTAHPPAAVILAATPGRTSDLVVRDQLTALMQRRGLSQEKADAVLSQEDRIIASIRDQDVLPPDVPAGLAALFPPNMTEFWHEELALNPAAAIIRYRGPVLVLQGGADNQVSPEKDAMLLDRSLTTRPDDHHQLSIVPNAIHPLKMATSTDGPAFAGPVAPDALKILGTWLNANLVRLAGR